MATLFAVYRVGRLLTRGETSDAYAHAARVHHAERVLHLPPENSLQHLLAHDWILHACNVYYTVLHFPVTVAFLVWGYLRRPPQEYRWARNLMVAVTGAALVLHVLFPLAPPRMFPRWGFEDSMRVLGPDPYTGSGGAMANQIAAMPSLHVGWALLIAYVVTRTGPRWVAILAWLHTVVTTLVVVATANHWWLDAMVAAALVGIAAWCIPAPHGPRSGLRFSRRVEHWGKLPSSAHGPDGP